MMEIIRRITVFGVLREGVGIGLKNTLSLIAAVFFVDFDHLDPLFECGNNHRYHDHSCRFEQRRDDLSPVYF